MANPIEELTSKIKSLSDTQESSKQSLGGVQERLGKLESLIKQLVTVYNPATSQSYVKEIDLPGILIVPMQPLASATVVDLTAAPGTTTIVNLTNTYGTILGIKIYARIGIVGLPKWRFQVVMDGVASPEWYILVGNPTGWTPWEQMSVESQGDGLTAGDFLLLASQSPFRSQFQLKSILATAAGAGELMVTAVGSYSI